MFRFVCCLRLFIVCAILAATTGLSFAETRLNGAGATFPYPLYKKWFDDYAKVDPSVTFNYQPEGSSIGIRKILSREVDFGATDKFLSDAELKAAPGKLLHIPTVLGAVSIVYHIPGVDKGLKLSGDVLVDIFTGKITRWNDTRIKALNAGIQLPDNAISVVHRSDGSGTTNTVTEYFSLVNAGWAQKVGKGARVTWPVGTGFDGNGAVAGHIKATPYTIGYVELAYALENELSIAALQNRAGKFTLPNALSTWAAAASGLNRIPKDFRTSLVNQPGKDAYPIVSMTWLLVYQRQLDPEKGKKLVEFLMWELTKAEKMTSTLHYCPLPEKVARKVKGAIKSINYRR